MDPDDLYTLRAQYWLGHYKLCIDEAKSIARRPMPPHLKEEREEFLLRSYLALGQYDKVIQDAFGNDRSPSICGLRMRAQYELAKTNNDTETRSTIISTLQAMLNDPDPSVANSSSVQLTSCHVFLHQGDMTREALQCVHLGTTMEHLATSVQIYIKMERLDLADTQLSLMKQADEDSILTQLCTSYLHIANGSTRADDATYIISSLTEQYGPSPLLLNIMAVSLIIAGKYELAEASLKEAMIDDPNNVDAMVNSIVCFQHMGSGKSEELMTMMKKLQDCKEAQGHYFIQGYNRMIGAMDRESAKYAPKALA